MADNQLLWMEVKIWRNEKMARPVDWLIMEPELKGWVRDV